MEEKILPYAVRITERSKQKEFCDMLNKDGYRCIQPLADGFCVILVNVELKRWGGMNRPCGTTCQNSRLYTLVKFMTEVY